MSGVEPQLDRARRELAWWIGGREAALGKRAAGLGGGVTAVWDDARLGRLHGERLTVAHRATVERWERVRATVAGLTDSDRTVAELVWTPFGSARATWQAQSCFVVEGRALLGLVLRCETFARAWQRVSGGGVTVTADGLATLSDGERALRWLEDEVAGVRAKSGRALPLGHRLEPALREAVAREERCAAAYEELRRGREEERASARADRLAVVLEETRRRLWG